MNRFYILINGIRNLALGEAFLKHSKGWPLMENFRAQIISYNDCVEMVEKGSLPSSKSWFPKENEWAIVILEEAKQYRDTCVMITTAWTDFRSGWYAREKH